MITNYLNSVQKVYQQAQPNEAWLNQQEKLKAQKNFLHRTSLKGEDEVYLSYQKAKTVLDAINTVENYKDTNESGLSVFKSVFDVLGKVKDVVMKMAPEIGFSIGGILAGYYARFTKNKTPALNKFFIALPFLATFVMTSASYFLSSRVKNELGNMVKFQARKNDLEDLRNFIVYTPEQIQQAEELAKQQAEKKEQAIDKISQVKDAKETAKTYTEIVKNRSEYFQEKKRKQQDVDKKASLWDRAKSLHKMDEAKSDQQLLHQIFSELNLGTLQYQEKAQDAANTVLVSKTLLGALAGGVVSLGMMALDKAKPMTPLFKKVKLLAVPAAGLAAYVLAAYNREKFMAKAEASARFKTEQDMIKDPRHFMQYEKADYKFVSNIHAPAPLYKSFIQTIKDRFNFYDQARKNYKQFKEYQKITEKEQQKLKETLKLITPTDQQLEEARRLQQSTFKMLDKFEVLADKNYRDIEELTGYFQKLTDSAIKFVGIFMGLIAFVKLTKMNLDKLPLEKIPFGELLKNTGATSLVKRSLYFTAPMGLVLLPLLYLSNKLSDIQDKSQKGVIIGSIKETADPMYFVES